MSGVSVLQFGNTTKQDRALLRRFVAFHWKHYRHEPRYIPLLDYEYLGLKLLGIRGFFEPGNLFFRHAEIRFFLAQAGGETVGRCMALVNHRHNARWNDRAGFFGQFECVDDTGVAAVLLEEAARWLKQHGMTVIRGPQNLPFNEATPGVLTAGFDSRPVVYYHFNKPYYADLLQAVGFAPLCRVFSWEVPVMNPMEEKLERVGRRVMERFQVTVERFGERPFALRTKEMLEVYNEAWHDNFGFVPFTEEEFSTIMKDLALIMDKDLFLFLYVKGELAAFFGGVPNIFERMAPLPWCRRCELVRAVRMLLTKGRITGFRVGYLGVKKQYRRLGLDGVMLWQQKMLTQRAGYEYGDLGWVLEGNASTINLAAFMRAVPSKTYTIFQKEIP
ncbi:MAG: hypothetical protein MUE60_14050 [Candidatus Eisenbacteria bacterium]|jgi:hypothetical protein|nr:hypothetical protein [Candidatus Eisenbacteria bacterium]